ncbi:hypothetical protein ACLMAB_18560 [Brevibacillus laterosporus]
MHCAYSNDLFTIIIERKKKSPEKTYRDYIQHKRIEKIREENQQRCIEHHYLMNRF